jgi:protein AIR1/2
VPLHKSCIQCEFSPKFTVNTGCANPRVQNCPSLWRTYTYLLPHERDELLQQRLLKRNCELGVDQGGEGFIAAEDWCYNCAGCGHLGDDCPQGSSRTRDRPGERTSAFSAFNMSRGPYGLAEPHEAIQRLRDRSRSPPSRAGPSVLPDAHRRPGESGRKKQADNLRKAQRRREEQDEEVQDWFTERTNERTTGHSGRSRRNGDSSRGASHTDWPRLSKDKEHRETHRDRGDQRRDHRQRDHDRNRDRDDDRKPAKSLKDRLSNGHSLSLWSVVLSAVARSGTVSAVSHS